MDETEAYPGNGQHGGDKFPRHPAGSGQDDSPHDAIIIGRDNVTQMSTAVRRGSHRDWMLLHHREVPPPDWDALTVPAPPGVRTRAVYDERFARDPAGMDLIRARMALGEEARLLGRDISCSLRLADSFGGLLLLPAQEGAAALLFVDQPAPEQYCGGFEILWHIAAPVGNSAGIPFADQSQPWLN